MTFSHAENEATMEMKELDNWVECPSLGMSSNRLLMNHSSCSTQFWFRILWNVTVKSRERNVAVLNELWTSSPEFSLNVQKHMTNTRTIFLRFSPYRDGSWFQKLMSREIQISSLRPSEYLGSVLPTLPNYSGIDHHSLKVFQTVLSSSRSTACGRLSCTSRKLLLLRSMLITLSQFESTAKSHIFHMSGRMLVRLSAKEEYFWDSDFPETDFWATLRLLSKSSVKTKNSKRQDFQFWERGS
jgi:hypothetical protein